MSSRRLVAAGVALLALLAAPVVASAQSRAPAQPTPPAVRAPWRLAGAAPDDAERMRGVLVRYAAEERAHRDVAFLLGLDAAGLSVTGAGFLATARPADGVNLAFAVSWFVLATAQCALAVVTQLPGPLESVRDAYEDGLRTARDRRQLAARTESRLSTMARLLEPLRQSATAWLTVAVLAATSGAAMVVTAMVLPNLGAPVEPILYLGLPLFGLAAQALSMRLMGQRTEAIDRALREYRRGATPGP